MQVLVNLVLFIAVAIMWIKLNRPQKDDPRMSRGLQLLQSKISVLEDLSDRVDHQSQEVAKILEMKLKEIQGHLAQTDQQMQSIEQSMQKTLEVAKIFQDKVPHQQIIERQNTAKYVQAAKMAHAGIAAEEIMTQLNLTRGEVDLIVKVNKDQLQFSVDDLPAWAEQTPASMAQDPYSVEALIQKSPYQNIERNKKEEVSKNLSALGDRFRQAIDQKPSQAQFVPPAQVAPQVQAVPQANQGPVIKKVIFPRIDTKDDLFR
jgi:hypothetical protein